MPNSTHSRGFKRLFDTVVSNVAQPLQDRLQETWQDENQPDASNQVSQDVVLVTTALMSKRNGLTRGQYAFLGDLYDHAFRQDYLGTSIDEHIARFVEAAAEGQNWEPPAVTLNLLRGYDALAKTTMARMYKDYLMKVISMTLTTVEQPSPRDQEIIAEFDQFWTEVVTATRTPHLRLRRESTPLIADLNNAVLEFIGPARQVIKTVEQLSVMPGLQDTEGFIRRSFTNYCAQAILVDSIVDTKELELFHDLAPTLTFFGHQGSLQNLQEIFKNASKNIAPNETPLLVSILDIYDQSMHTELGRRARSLYFRLANTAFKSDLTVSQEELVWLEKFKETLYPGGAALEATQRLETVGSRHGRQATIHQAQHVGTKQEVPKLTLDQSLDELNFLVGLDSVKQDVAQLVNLLKVQKMREEKGLPGTAIPKNLVFSGNPGTGKSSVARIVAHIYRELGIFRKGHVTEVDRAKLVTANSGQTASKIREAVSSTRGGILFIDEAYSLVLDRPQSDGLESVDALVKAMDDHKDAVVVILGGCPEKLAEFINAHSSLKTRFTKSFSFEDYTPDQMLDIFDLFGARAAFKTSPTARALVRALFEELHSQRREGFGNARDVRRVFEGIIGNQANRVINLPAVNEEILSTITDDDVLPFVAALERR